MRPEHYLCNEPSEEKKQVKILFITENVADLGVTILSASHTRCGLGI